ncbi:MAG: Fur family transcriptional regulator [Acidobacteriota bacterium]
MSARELESRLRAGGARPTRQRRTVFAALAACADHPTAEMLHRMARRRIPDLSLATVYKTLDLLVEARLAGRFVDVNGVARYDARTEPHDHRRCLRCGRVEDVNLPRRSRRLADIRVPGFAITGCHFELLGVCDRCPGGARPAEAGRTTHVPTL